LCYGRFPQRDLTSGSGDSVKMYEREHIPLKRQYKKKTDETKEDSFKFSLGSNICFCFPYLQDNSSFYFSPHFLYTLFSNQYLFSCCCNDPVSILEKPWSLPHLIRTNDTGRVFKVSKALGSWRCKHINELYTESDPKDGCSNV